MSGAEYTVDVIAGDGIGPEVMPAAVACIDALAPALDFTRDLAGPGVGIGLLPQARPDDAGRRHRPAGHR